MIHWRPSFSWPRFDPHPFARRGTDAIVGVACFHVVVAGLLVSAAVTANATPVAALIYIFVLLGAVLRLPGMVGWLPLILCGSSALALVGALFKVGPIRLSLFAAQNILLGFMASGGWVAAYHGRYLDLTVKPWQHIAADQLGVSILFVLHLRSIILRSRDPNG